MPEHLAGGTKAADDEGLISYTGPAGEFGIEAAEVGDLFRSDTTPKQAFALLAKRLQRPSSCAELPGLCLSGLSDGRYTVTWGHERGPLVLVAFADDEARLKVLLVEWS
jgi:hypothetical protein